MYKDIKAPPVTISSVEAAYDLQTKKQGAAFTVSRSVKAFLRRQLQIKFGGAGNTRTIENMEVCRYKDLIGNSIVVTFEVQPGQGSARLVDIEYIVPTASVDMYVNTNAMPQPFELNSAAGSDSTIAVSNPVDHNRFACDLRNHDDVVALGMAADMYIADHGELMESGKKSELERHTNLINHYAKKMPAETVRSCYLQN